jgi:hypothetical protein
MKRPGKETVPVFEDLLRRLGLRDLNSGASGARWVERPGGPEIISVNPATGEPIGRVVGASADD